MILHRRKPKRRPGWGGSSRYQPISRSGKKPVKNIGVSVEVIEDHVRVRALEYQGIAIPGPCRGGCHQVRPRLSKAVQADQLVRAEWQLTHKKLELGVRDRRKESHVAAGRAQD